MNGNLEKEKERSKRGREEKRDMMEKGKGGRS